MDPDTIIFLPGFLIDTIEKQADEAIIIKSHSQSTKARCPSCSIESERTHGCYSRKPQTLPILGIQTILQLKVRRFVFIHPPCPRKTFAETIDQVAPRFGRRSIQLNGFLRSLAFETSAEAAARICTKLNIVISSDTILRPLRATSIPPSREVRILGVDDLAFKKNTSYGTILVDLESRRMIDLLPERTADRLASW